MKKTFLLLVIFGLCWGPYLNIGIGFFADTQVAIAIIIIVLSGISPWQKAPRDIKWVVFTISLLALLAIFLSLGYDDWIYIPALRLLRAAIILYACWCLVVRIYKQWGDKADRILVTGIYLGIVAHGVLMIIQFIDPTLREAVTKWTFASEGLDINLRTRMPGLTTGGGAQLSAFMSIGFILFPYCYAAARSWAIKILLAVGLAVTAIAIVLSGRSGVYTAIFLFPPMIVLVGYYNRETGGLIPFTLRLVGIACVILICATGIFYLDRFLRSSSEGTDYSNYAFERNLDMFLNPDEGIVKNSTIIELWNNHLVFPTDIRTLLVGDLQNMDHSQGAGGVVTRKVDSDIGYVRLLFGYGIFGSLFHYAIYLFMIKNLWGVRYNNYMMSGTAIFILVMIFIFNAKEVFFFTRIGWSICALLYCGAICSAILRERRNRQFVGSAGAGKATVRVQFNESMGPVHR